VQAGNQGGDAAICQQPLASRNYVFHHSFLPVRRMTEDNKKSRMTI